MLWALTHAHGFMSTSFFSYYLDLQSDRPRFLRLRRASLSWIDGGTMEPRNSRSETWNSTSFAILCLLTRPMTLGSYLLEVPSLFYYSHWLGNPVMYKSAHWLHRCFRNINVPLSLASSAQLSPTSNKNTNIGEQMI